MSHITRRKSDALLANEHLKYLADQYFKDNCPFGTNRPMTLDDKDIKMLGGKKKKVKRKREPMSKKGKLWKKR